jgi:hypothetical protein
MCTQARSGPVSLFRFWIGGPNASLPRHIPGTDQPLTLTPPDSESPLAAESVPIDASGLYKIAHSVDGNGSGKGNPATAKFKSGQKKWNLFILVPIVCLYGLRRNPHMMKITFAVAIAAAVLMPAPLLVGAIPAEAKNLKMAQRRCSDRAGPRRQGPPPTE